MTPIKRCRACGTNLTDDNWNVKARPSRGRQCNTCYSAYRKTTWSGTKEYMREYFRKYKGIKERPGYIYVVSNPAWAGYLKIGRATDTSERLRAFNTASPHRDFNIEHSRHFPKILTAEAELHDALRGYRAQGEWFQLHVTDAVAKLDAVALKIRDREPDGA